MWGVGFEPTKSKQWILNPSPLTELGYPHMLALLWRDACLSNTYNSKHIQPKLYTLVTHRWNTNKIESAKCESFQPQFLFCGMYCGMYCGVHTSTKTERGGQDSNLRGDKPQWLSRPSPWTARAPPLSGVQTCNHLNLELKNTNLNSKIWWH